MTPDLSRRIARAFAAGAATPPEQELLRTAAGPADVRTVVDLPDDARMLLRDLETRGRPAVPEASDDDREELDRLHARNRLTMDYPVDLSFPAT